MSELLLREDVDILLNDLSEIKEALQSIARKVNEHE